MTAKYLIKTRENCSKASVLANAVKVTCPRDALIGTSWGARSPQKMGLLLPKK